MHQLRRCAAAMQFVAVSLLVVVALVPALADDYYFGDGTPDGKRSIGGGGHALFFDVGQDGRWLNRVQLFGSRYGHAQPPDEDFHLYVLDMDRSILADVSLPYSLWERGDEYWRDLPIPPVQVPQQFGIGLTFNAEQTKGIYVGVDNGQSFSYSWVPGIEGKLTDGFNWMVSATVEDEPEGDPAARDLLLLADGDAFFDTITRLSDDGASFETAGRGAVPIETVTGVRFGAFSVPVPGAVTVQMVSGRRLQGTLVAIDNERIRLTVAGTEMDIPRGEVARIEF